MALTPGCLDEPPVLLTERVCVHDVSKDVRGELDLNDSELEKCVAPECRTLKTVHPSVANSEPIRWVFRQPSVADRGNATARV
jgi:hypothetical protein